jgi:hypothetical protein
MSVLRPAPQATDIIEDHLTPDGPQLGMLMEQSRLSGILTFFFGPFYLQHVLHQRVLASGDSMSAET